MLLAPAHLRIRALDVLCSLAFLSLLLLLPSHISLSLPNTLSVFLTVNPQ